MEFLKRTIRRLHDIVNQEGRNAEQLAAHIHSRNQHHLLRGMPEKELEIRVDELTEQFRKEKHPAVRRAVIMAASRTGVRSAVDIFMGGLRSGDDELMTSAATLAPAFLVDLNDLSRMKQALSGLACGEDVSENLKQTAVSSLKKLEERKKLLVELAKKQC